MNSSNTLGWTVNTVPPFTTQIDDVLLVSDLKPNELSLNINSDMKGSSLASFGTFERNIQRRVRLVHLQCEDTIPRIDQLAGVLQQGILLVSLLQIFLISEFDP
jgi:hypothetical protein